MSDYLFDKQGPPDPEIARLEKLLGPLAYRGRAPRPPRRAPRWVWGSAGALAVAAAIALVLLGPWRGPAPRAGWPVVFTAAGERQEGLLPVGEWLETGDRRAELRAAELGTVTLEPGTRARIVETGATRHRMALASGTLRATIDAPPRRFVVETAHLVVTDLGCAFELSVDAAGRGRLVVTEGQVGVADRAGREVVVPAGATAVLSPSGAAPPRPSDATMAPSDAPTPTPREATTAPAPGDAAQAQPALRPQPAPQRKATPAPPRRPPPARSTPKSKPPTTRPTSPVTATTPQPKPSATKPTPPVTTPKPPATAPQPKPSTSPATKPAAPGFKLKHDPLRDLEGSVR